MPDICFHIGLYKTASSWMQRTVFPAVGGLGLGSGNNKNRILQRMKACFLERSPDVWQEAEGRELAEDLLACAVSDGPVLYSDEALYRAKIFLDSTREADFTGEPYLLATHLREFSRHAWQGKGRVSVFYFVRNQMDWLASFYAQLSNRIPGASQADFVRRIQALADRPSAFGGNVVKYDRLTAALYEALGRDNVLPLVYERLNEEQTWSTLRAFSGLALANERASGTGGHFKIRRHSPGSWTLRKYGEKLRPRGFADRVHKNLARLPGRRAGSINAHESLRRQVQAAYHQSNAEFERLSGLDLSGLGYYPET